MRARGLVALGFASLVAALAVTSVAAPATSTGVAAGMTRSSRLAHASPCEDPPVGPLTYHYPIRPFDRQHPIRGFFGDPRTVTGEELARDSPASVGSFGFHNGIDIAAAAGTAVYPVVSGVVSARLYADEITVLTGDGRRFQYFHIRPDVRVGEPVVAERTVLGTVLPEWLHVHLTEIDVFRAHNPLDPGHLEPYRDETAPFVDGLLFRTPYGQKLDPASLHGRVDIAADAADEPPLAVPGFWFGFPVTPALVAWRLSRPDGRVVLPERVVADFRRTEPDNHDFWQVYAAGTYQNFPVFAHHYYWRLPGRYLFRLTPQPLDTRPIPDGRYLLTVDVDDVCGNRGSLTERVTIANHV
jgi:hypothetical protein